MESRTSLPEIFFSRILPAVAAPPPKTPAAPYELPEMAALDKATAASRALYDEPAAADPRGLRIITRRFDLSTDFRRTVAARYGAQNVSNAWLKAYELILHYNLMPTVAPGAAAAPRMAHFTHFDNAAFPGSWILAAYHIAHTLCSIGQYEWRGSSLMDASTPRGRDGGPLEDSYHLYANYKKNWMMTPTNNGDVTIPANLIDMQRRLGRVVDLYTSDLGFDVSDDYAAQEAAQGLANLGQIIMGLMIVRPGGNMITKQYSFTRPFSLGLMALCTAFFNRIEICKPLFSKPGNSETYLVCLGYAGGFDESAEQKMAFARLEAKDSTSPFFNRAALGAAAAPLGGSFYSAALAAQQHLAEIQIDRNQRTIAEYKRLKALGPRGALEASHQFAEENAALIAAWMREYPMRRMPHARRLNVREMMNRGPSHRTRGPSHRGRGRGR